MPKANKVNVKEKVDDNVCDLSLCELREIPVKEIVSFKRVNILDLSSNRLTFLGNNFCNLKRLVKLDLSKNLIKFLPEEFGNLKNLRHLDLYNNQLEHLPLSFGDLHNLRYLDLKSNPLIPALAKIVGICSTTKDCQDSAKRTVEFMSAMQTEAIIAKQKYLQCSQKNLNTIPVQEEVENANKNQEGQQKSKKSKKSKSKKKSTTHNNPDAELNAIVFNTDQNITIAKTNKNKRSANGALKSSAKAKPSSTALLSLIMFLLLVTFNVVLIYMIMFKNPEIAEKLVESIPHQYRDWILTKTEVFRLRVTDWISEFRTPPEEH